MMSIQQILQDQYAPITSEVGFIECNVNTAVKAFVNWQREVQIRNHVDINIHEVRGEFADKIKALLPLTSIEARRYLFLPTKSAWTAFFDNGWHGTDVFSVVSHLAMIIKCRGIRAVSIPHTKRKLPEGDLGRYGATIFELYEGSKDKCNFLNIRRSVCSADDGGRWRFDVGGDQLDFEQSEKYTAPRVQDRFTRDMLDEYLKYYGISLFDTSFYDSDTSAFLASKNGPRLAGSRDYSLDEVRSSF